MTNDVSDHDLLVALAATGPLTRRTFVEAVDRLREKVGRGISLSVSVEPQPTGSGELAFPTVVTDDTAFDVLLRASLLLDEAGLEELWLEPAAFPGSVADVERASVQDAAAYLQTLLQLDRIIDGLVAETLESGTLLAAAARVRDVVAAGP